MNAMDITTTRAVIESLLLAADGPLPFTTFVELIPEAGEDVIQDALTELVAYYQGPERGIHLVEIAGGYRFRTNSEAGPYVRGMYEAKPVRISRPAMETLAIIAYRQPITRAQVEELRGVDCSGVIRTLCEYELTETIGRLDDVGRPHLYGTTSRFLEFFGLGGIVDLPGLNANELGLLDEMKAQLDLDFDGAGGDKDAPSEQE